MTDEMAPFTLRSAAGLPPAYSPLSDAVLIVIDAQEEYGSAGALALSGLDPALQNIEGLLLKGRKAGAEIVHIAHEGSTGRAFDPDQGGQIIGQVAPVEGETVLDFTMGSGTTGVACKQTGREFIGIEKDPTYYALAEKRIRLTARQLELF